MIRPPFVGDEARDKLLMLLTAVYQGAGMEAIAEEGDITADAAEDARSLVDLAVLGLVAPQLPRLAAEVPGVGIGHPALDNARGAVALDAQGIGLTLEASGGLARAEAQVLAVRPARADQGTQAALDVLGDVLQVLLRLLFRHGFIDMTDAALGDVVEEEDDGVAAAPEVPEQDALGAPGVRRLALGAYWRQ
jgi:hypothetical protein